MNKNPLPFIFLSWIIYLKGKKSIGMSLKFFSEGFFKLLDSKHMSKLKEKISQSPDEAKKGEEDIMMSPKPELSQIYGCPPLRYQAIQNERTDWEAFN